MEVPPPGNRALAYPSETPIPARSDAGERVRFAPDDPKSLISTTARLVDEALDLLEHAKKADDRRTALTALREARDGLALLMRSAGMLAGDPAVVIDARKQSIELFAGLTTDELRRLANGVNADEIETEFRDRKVLAP